MPKSNLLKGFAAPDSRTIADNADGSGREQLPAVRANPLKFCVGTSAHGEDANLPSEPTPRNAPEGAAMNGAAAPKRSRVAGVEGGASGPPPTEIARDFRSRMLGGTLD
jgi:hypothetical protein